MRERVLLGLLLRDSNAQASSKPFWRFFGEQADCGNYVIVMPHCNNPSKFSFLSQYMGNSLDLFMSFFNH